MFATKPVDKEFILIYKHVLSVRTDSFDFELGKVLNTPSTQSIIAVCPLYHRFVCI